MLLIHLGSAQLRQALALRLVALSAMRGTALGTQPRHGTKEEKNNNTHRHRDEENRSCGRGLLGSSLNVVLGRVRLGYTADLLY
ncbi:uncharacterized protein J3D65DRAFT_628919 [Phyllosticta citribraziliensis]|uniref:Secreted protein n=1 Tax=Phyllosticta citribraziliensis TaxID=989973 RepID=A0ABR1LHT6_9PEZI